MMIVIGSKALALRGIDTGRKSLDIDVVGTYDDIVAFAEKQGKIRACYPVKGGDKLVVKTDRIIIEGELTWEGTSAAALQDLITNDIFGTDIMTEDGIQYFVPSIDLLYMLKMSHRYLKNSPHFLKTMRDIQMLREKGAVIKARHADFYEQRMKDTYDYKHPSLMQSKKNFFSDDGIKYVYDHDSIHEAVAHLGKPAYQFYKPDENEVFCSQEMFEAAGRAVQLYGVLEEAYVLALERSQIPFPGLLTPKQSFDIALMKVCTSITSGWFREFAYESYDDVQAMYSDTYKHKFDHAVRLGEVKPFDPNNAAY